MHKCKWCKLEAEYKNKQSFASHVSFCVMNPNLKPRKYPSRLVPKINLILNCLKCENEFSKEYTQSEINRNRTSKFCSRSCGNTRVHSEETKNKISESLKISEAAKEGNLNRKVIRKEKFAEIFICKYCKEEGLSYRGPKLYHPDCARKSSGGIRKGSGRGKKGWYKGYWCDSSWELAFIIYNIDKEIKFERNNKSFNYNYLGKNRLFYPDFISGDKYIEIKNYRSDYTDAKIHNFPYSIEVLYLDEIKPYLEYAVKTYGKDFIKLYKNKMQE